MPVLLFPSTTPYPTPNRTNPMKSPQSIRSLAALTVALFLPAPALHATVVSADSTDTLVETRWVQADSSNVLINTRDYVYLTVNATHGTVLPPERQFAPNTNVELTPAPDLGYVFSKWTGDATGNANPLSLLLDVDKTLTAAFSQDPRDPDADGLTNYQELITYLTNPDVPDTDADGFTDGYEVAQGFSPTLDTSSPDTRMVAYTALEIRFGAGVGKTYRIESSFDLQTWTPVETGIPGTGTVVTRFYTTQVIPKRYFRAVRE
jgi:hypothetical protein